MRMWLISPEKLCRKHLLGEHVELHMLVGCIRKGISIKGYIEGKLADPQLIIKRHNELVAEMKRRSYKHKSKLPGFKCGLKGKISISANMKELSRRCKECRRLLR
jgi:hypothetical protein